MADANIKAVITADDRASGTLKRFGSNANGVGNGLRKGFRLAALGAVAAGAAITAFGVSSVKSFMESEDSITQLNAVLKSTKGIAGVTAKSALDLADSLQKITKFSDEEVLSAENLLLTFTKISKDIFPEATKTVLDMSTALGQDTKSSAIQLGKALQDPILGVTALRRVGVNFNSAQTEVIKKLVETGQSAKAQKMILAELKTEFGGSAVAAGQTFAGKLAILKNRFDELKETIGGFIATTLVGLADAIGKFVASDSFRIWVTNVRNAVMSLVNFIMIFYKAAFKVIADSWQFVKPSLMELWNTIQTDLLPALRQLWKEVGPTLGPALKTLGIIVGVFIVASIILLAKALTSLIKIISFFINVSVRTTQMVRVLTSALMSIGMIIYQHVIAPIGRAISWLHNLNMAFFRLVGGIAMAMAPVFNIIVAPFQAAFNWIMGAIEGVKSAISSLTSSASTPIGAIGKLVSSVGKRAGGGPVTGGAPYVVGEKGPELFVPRQSGNIIPNNKVSGGGGGSTTININIPMMTGSPSERRKVARMLIKDIQDIAAMNGTTASNMMNSNYGLVT